MHTNRTAAYGIYSRNVALPDVVGALNQAGFEKEDICMVLSPAHPDAAVVRDTSIFGSESDESANSVRMIHWFSEFGAVVIPTVCSFTRSHVFFQALFSEKNASPLSRGSRTLIDLGFSQYDAKRLGQQLCDVGALVYVACQEHAKANAIELLRSTGAREAASLESLSVAALAS